ncbi:40-kDa huntingtin-associated protein-like isoform X1 [Apostichopus japonicus]|uniref:40-kDa huntingtin-associated protein-like isoform X1 n=1 Tax=Stichopus japonicus TaxID=307972 RepID=UPI003AB454D7
MDREVDFLARYRMVSGKLKKRFLRKPNVAEAIQQFGALGRALDSQECPPYAAMCSLAQARCEHLQGNQSWEVQYLVDSANHFLKAHWSDETLKCPNFQEHLMAAINCYNHALRVCIEQKQPALAAMYSLQLGDHLMKLGKPGEAITHYQRAAEFQYQTPLDCLNSMAKVSSCKINIGDYDGALTTLTEMEYLVRERGTRNHTGRPLGAYSDILASCEIKRILLLVLLQPTPQRIRPEHAQTLERFTWNTTADGNSTNVSLSEELFILLQSVVMACQSKDVEALQALQTDLWKHFTAEQNHLLHLVVEQITKAGPDVSSRLH